jgi:hypothetical protein
MSLNKVSKSHESFLTSFLVLQMIRGGGEDESNDEGSLVSFGEFVSAFWSLQSQE